MNRVLLAGMAGLAAGVAISSCTVDREGAPCVNDDNCPRSQYCDLTNKCVELTSKLDAGTACQLAMVSMSQKLSACVGGPAETWLEEILPQQICGTITASITAGRETFAPLKLKECRAGILGASCAELATRKPGQFIAECNMLTGTVASGSACTTDKDCAAGYCNTTTGCPGTCRAFVSEGVACAGTDVCEPGATCAGGTCKRYITSGSCNDADAGPCQPYSHYCSGTGCTPRLPAGTPDCNPLNSFCQSNVNCAGSPTGAKLCQVGAPLDTVCPNLSNVCEHFAYCQQRTGGNFCTPVPAAGGGCGFTPPSGAQDFVLYCRQSYCNGFTCVSYLGLGVACNNNNVACGPLARCVGGACRSEFCP